MGDWIFWTLVGVAALLMVLRISIRFRNHFAAHKEAREIGTIRCRKCGFRGPLLGWATFFGVKKLVCPKCRSADWEKDRPSRSQSPSQT